MGMVIGYVHMCVFKDYSEYRSLINIFPRVGRLFYVSFMFVHTLTIKGILNTMISLYRARDPFGHPLKKDCRIWDEI